MFYLPTEEGQGLLEYGLILVLIAVTVVAVVGVLGQQISNIFVDVNNQMESANNN